MLTGVSIRQLLRLCHDSVAASFPARAGAGTSWSPAAESPGNRCCGHCPQMPRRRFGPRSTPRDTPPACAQASAHSRCFFFAGRSVASAVRVPRRPLRPTRQRRHPPPRRLPLRLCPLCHQPQQHLSQQTLPHTTPQLPSPKEPRQASSTMLARPCPKPKRAPPPTPRSSRI